MGRFHPASIPGKDVWVLRTSDGRLYAIKNSCPHRGAPICLGDVTGTFIPSDPGQYVYGMRERLIRCHHHGYEYDLETGQPLYTEANERLVRYDVTVQNGEIFVSARGR